MEIPKIYDPKTTEDKWYKHWLKNNFFKSTPDSREPYTIVMPPPNVTGVLHMGHMLNYTLQDVLIRKARLEGKNACWVPGTDHASIATEAKVVALLKEKGINKTDLSREDFLKHAWEWKEKYGGIILEQFKKLGCSCDWDRTKFTMDEDMSEAVIDVFIDLYNKGQIYRGVRMVNWDPQGLTAVSDEEVIHKEVNSKLFYVKYKLVNEDNSPLSFVEGQGAEAFITIATTRPETILGDTAVCVNPTDERYQHLKGKRCIIPMVNRSVPIIFDEYVDKEFGTGALKVTPAHDVNDYKLGVKHKLEVIDTIAADGKMSAAAKFYIGEDRFIVRKKIIKDLEQLGAVLKTEDIKNKVGYSERTNAVIEPKLSMQWFLKMDKISKPALENVLNENVKLIPEKFINTYKHWMENVHDWCISRQLWWGQRIPAWYDENGNTVVAKTHEEAIEKYKIQFPTSNIQHLSQDEDVVDTWFSSWLWPISVFDGFKNPNNADINYYYPTNDLITAPEILFFWVARMIIAGYEYKNEKPFKNVYLTGIVRDKLGRKMSKSLGNSPDPLDLIEKYGADGVRVGMLLCSPAGNDLPFDEALCEQGRNFSNKIWNAFRLVSMWEVADDLQKTGSGFINENESQQPTNYWIPQPDENKKAIEWFDYKLDVELQKINFLYSKYRISEALMATYKLVWDDFCAWYLEMIKPEFVDGKSNPIDKETYDATIIFFEKLLKIVHPFMPFITEEIWHLIKNRSEEECIIVSKWPKVKPITLGNFDDDNVYIKYSKNGVLRAVEKINVFSDFEMIKDAIKFIRTTRLKRNLKNQERIEVISMSLNNQEISVNYWKDIIEKFTNCNLIITDDGLTKTQYDCWINAKMDFYIAKKDAKSKEDVEKLIEELKYTQGFLNSVLKKLSNEKFVSNAKPEIIEIERKKQSDAEAKIKSLEEQLVSLKK